MNLWYPLRAEALFSFATPSSQTAPQSTRITTTSCQQIPLSINSPPFMPTISQAAPVASISLTVLELVQLLAASKKDHLPEWKLTQNNGDLLQSHECFAHFKSARLCISYGRRQINVLENTRYRLGEHRHYKVCVLWHYVPRCSTKAGTEVQPNIRCGWQFPN